MEILSKLFGSEAKVRLLRLFFFNPEGRYTLAELSARTKSSSVAVRKAVAALLAAGFVARKKVAKKAPKMSPRSARKALIDAYSLDAAFPYLDALADLVALPSIRADDRLTKKILPAGRIRVLIASGIFSGEPNAKLDLLVVGEDISERRLRGIVESLQAEIGRELAYACLSTADFQYRLSMYDRLVRDVLDFPHIVLVDKLGLQSPR